MQIKITLRVCNTHSELLSSREQAAINVDEDTEKKGTLFTVFYFSESLIRAVQETPQTYSLPE